MHKLIRIDETGYPVLPEVSMGTRKLAQVDGGTTYYVLSYACRQIYGVIVALTNT